MEGRQFDQIARGLSGGGTRRHLLGGLAAMVGAGAGLTGATAKHKRCHGGTIRCGNKCVTGACCPGKKCEGTNQCKCVKAVAGDTFCSAKNELIACAPCDSDAVCENGFRCAKSDLCAGLTALCLPPCL